MKGMTIGKIAAACGGKVIGEVTRPETEVSAVVADSRSAGPDCLFIALRGENSDGHRYIPQAFEKGALCCVSEQRIENAGGPYILVDSTYDAVEKIAGYYRTQLSIPIIGITGSVGKTTAKEMVAAVLSQRFNVLKTEKNNNNNLGVPLTLLRIQPEHEAAVVEMGISHFGEMDAMAKTAAPDMALFTVIGYSHLEFLGDRDGVLRAKTEMLAHMKPDARLFINGDDDKLEGLDCTQKKFSFGLDKAADCYAEDIHLLDGCGMGCDIVCGERRISVDIPAFGAHMIYAALEGAAVGMEFGLTDEEIKAGIAAYETVGYRSLLENADGITIINDCYNSNPNSAASALMSLSALPGRHVCILGDMLELGEMSQQLHREIGEYAAHSGADVVIACGTLAQDIYKGARESGCQMGAWYFPDKTSLFSVLSSLVKSGDAILVKASRGMRFEEIVEELKALAPQL